MPKKSEKWVPKSENLFGWLVVFYMEGIAKMDDPNGTATYFDSKFESFGFGTIQSFGLELDF